MSYDTHIFVDKLKNLKFQFWISAITVVVSSPIRCLIEKKSEFLNFFLSKLRNNEQFLLEIWSFFENLGQIKIPLFWQIKKDVSLQNTIQM